MRLLVGLFYEHVDMTFSRDFVCVRLFVSFAEMQIKQDTLAG